MSNTFPSVLRVPENNISSGASGRLSTSTGEGSISKESTTSASSANPLKEKSQDEIIADAERFARENGLEEYIEVLKRGALVAQNPEALDRVPGLTDEEKDALRLEGEKPWSQPFMLYYLVVMCSLAACVQGVRVLCICARAGLD